MPRIKYHKYFTGQIIFRLPLAILFVLFSDYDICHAFAVAQPQIGIPAWVAKNIRRKKLVVDWDDLWGGGFANEHTRIVAKVISFSEKYFVRFADRITYVSDFIGKEIDKLGMEVIKEKVPNGSNISQIDVLDKAESRQKLGLDPNGRYLVSVGNTYTDSLGIMLEAFSEITESENAKLIMVGEGEVTPKFQKLFDSLKDRITVTGKRPFSEIPYYLGSADALLLPMDDSIAEKSRFPMRFGDYLSAGRPIVSNAVGEIEYYMKKYDCGLCSDPRSPEGFSRNILLALNDREVSERISSNARKLAEGDINWKNIIWKLDRNIYKDLF